MSEEWKEEGEGEGFHGGVSGNFSALNRRRVPVLTTMEG